MKSWYLMLTICALMAGIIIRYFIIAYLILHPKSKKSGKTPDDFNLSYTEFTVVTTDRLLIKGWIIHAHQQNARGTVILAHNLGADKLHMIPYSRFLSQAGFNSVVFDFRSHGTSTNYWKSWNMLQGLERDLSAVRHMVIESSWFQRRPILTLMGFSMGTFPIVTKGWQFPEVKAVILDSGPFQSLGHGFRHELKRSTKHYRKIPATLKVVWWRLMLGNTEVCIEEGLKRLNTQAILFVHGGLDMVIPSENTTRLFTLCKRYNTYYWLIPDAHHLDGYTLYRKIYSKKIIDFLKNSITTIPC